MKKLILLCLVAFVAIAANAQYGKAAKEPILAGDTVTNAIAFSKVISATAGYNSVVFQPTITRASGKVYGWVKLYGSLNGTDYNTTKAGSAIALDSAHVALPSTGHAAPILGVNISGAPYSNYKLTMTNDSTGKGTLIIWSLYRKQATTITAP